MDKHPSHRASFDYPIDRYRVMNGTTVIADSTQVVLLNESSSKGRAQAVAYFPLADVNSQYLTPTDHHTVCPLKGQASYYTVTVGDRSLDNAAWYYPEPLSHVEEIRDCIAFYPDKLTIEILR